MNGWQETATTIKNKKQKNLWCSDVLSVNVVIFDSMMSCWCIMNRCTSWGKRGWEEEYIVNRHIFGCRHWTLSHSVSVENMANVPPSPFFKCVCFCKVELCNIFYDNSLQSFFFLKFLIFLFLCVHHHSFFHSLSFSTHLPPLKMISCPVSSLGDSGEKQG